MPLLPTRVLFLGGGGSPDVKTVRLLEDGSQRGQYVCLSHCWGNPSLMAKTTTKNLEMHLREVPVSTLPTTLQDAIDITWRLGIEYLWVDSLCILQDDEKDWETQASRMADIYENAYVTIAATSSRDGRGGFYRRNLSVDTVKRLRYLPMDRPPVEVIATKPYRHFDLSGIKSAPEMDEFVLLSRAWVFQERQLSPRILHFCNRELVFECQEGSLCQCGESPTVAGSKQSISEILAGTKDLHPIATNRGWWVIVRRYTRLALSFDKDLLPALSGIARRVAATRPGDEYLAGIWRSGLPKSLMWFVPCPFWNSEETIDLATWRRPSEPRAPSWSWASVVAPISWSLPEGMESRSLFTEVEHASCTSLSTDPFGRVSGGLLRMRGPAIGTSLSWTNQSLGGQQWPEFGVLQPHEGPRIFSRLVSPDYPFFIEDSSPIRVLIVFVSTTTGLILRSVKDTGKYERIAMVNYHAQGDSPHVIRWLKQVQRVTVEII